MDPRITQKWQELSDFIVFRNSLDLGALSRLMDIFAQDNSQDPSSFADQITAFLEAVNSQAKMRPNGQADLLAILATDSLINNLYCYSKNGEAFQPNSSSFYGWMSSSQMSFDHSNMSERQAQIISQLIIALANSQSFFKRLKISIQKSRNQQKIKRFVQILLETLDKILAKERSSREHFLKLRSKYVGLDNRIKWQVNYFPVNQVIFSSQLNKVVAVLTEGGDNVHLALLRMYLAWQQDSKLYQGVKFTGEEMLANLYRYYISSFKDVEELFEQGKHPLFRFLRNHLALLFTPTLRKFHQIVVKISPRCGSESGFNFYKTGYTHLDSQLSQFINQLPNELLKLLLQLKDIVEEQHPAHETFALTAVKKMFFYSFLLNQSLMEELYPRHDPSKYSQTYNHILNLFFQGSVRKYSHLPQSQHQPINQLIQKLSGSLDSRIIHQYVKLETDELGQFQIRENILNHDYEVVSTVLTLLQFTPKDSKQFQMKKVSSVAPQSPVYRHFKTQGLKIDEPHQELQLATWMSVGGSREWGSRASKAPKPSLSQRLKSLKTISASVRSQLSCESESFLPYFQS